MRFPFYSRHRYTHPSSPSCWLCQVIKRRSSDCAAQECGYDIWNLEVSVKVTNEATAVSKPFRPSLQPRLQSAAVECTGWFCARFLSGWLFRPTVAWDPEAPGNKESLMIDDLMARSVALLERWACAVEPFWHGVVGDATMSDTTKFYRLERSGPVCLNNDFQFISGYAITSYAAS